MKKKDTKRKDREPIDYWKSSSDMMTALILVLLLVIMFLVLYIMQLPDEDMIDKNIDKYEDMDKHDDGTSNRVDDGVAHEDDDGHNDSHDNGNGNGNGGGNSKGDDEGDYPNEGEGKKSAVLVSLVDAETEKAIKKKGVTFELYSDSNALMTLNTYYPKKKSYKTYETTKDGSFYLPEKVLETTYYLHQISDLEGYDLVDKVKFKIDGIYDWPDPFLVKVPMYPKRDVIRVQMTDKQDGRSITGGSFEIIAAEDIVTKDGTVRVKKGERADTITCDENGYAESKHLYLGEYNIKQSVIPEYYASNDEVISVSLTDNKESEEDEKKQSKDASEESDDASNQNINAVRAEKTKICFVLTDELTGSPISGAVYNVEGPDLNEVYTTNENGQIILDEVQKDSKYIFTENSSIGDYIVAIKPIEVTVSTKGRIGKDAQADVIATNRLLRLDVGVRDMILRTHLVDVKVELFADSGKSILAWTSNGAFTEITGLSEGKYYLNINGDKTKKYPVTVTNTAEIQRYNINILTANSYTAIGVAAIAVAILLLLAVYIIKGISVRRKLKKTINDAEKNNDTMEE